MAYGQVDKSFAPKTLVGIDRGEAPPLVKYDGEQMPAVQREIAQLDKATDQLAATVRDLLQRMQPVLYAAPTQTSAAVLPSPAVTCPVSDGIAMMTERVWAEERALRMALDNLQV